MLRKRKTPEKHLIYFDLRDSCKEPGCAICRLLQRAVHNHIDSVLYELVNDAETRRSLRASLGFCKEHVLKALSMSDAFGLAIIYDDILSRVVASLGERRAPHPLQECPLCATRRTFEKMYVDTLRRHLMEPELQKAFSSGTGLRLPHLRLVSEDLDEPSSTFLFAAEERMMKQTIRDVHEFIRKQDYRFGKEGFSEREASSWKLAMCIVSGE